MSGLKKKHWTEKEELILFDFWANKITDLRKAKRNSHIYAAMVEEFKTKYGITTRAKEIQRKINNLTQRYRIEKKMMKDSGGSQSEWGLFEHVHQILGRFASSDLHRTNEDMSCDFTNKTVAESQDDEKLEDFHETEPPSNDTSFAQENNATTAELLTPKTCNVLRNPPKKRKIHERSTSSATKTYINAALEKLDKITKKKNKPETEFDIYCKSVAKQLNDMPTGMALRCQLKIQEVLTKFRLQNQFPTQPVHEIHYSNPTSVQSLPDDSMATNVCFIPVENKYSENTLSSYNN